MNSFVGLLVGPILVIGAVVLISWNEGREVHALNGLADASSALVEADATAAPPADEGKLVHVVGTATASAPISDPDLTIPFAGQVAVARNVQMYQWEEKKQSQTRDKLGGGQETVTTYTYDQVWSGTPVDSTQFQHPEGHANPAMPFATTRWAASDAKLGNYTLSADTLGLVAPTTALTPDAPDGWTAAAGTLQKGDPATPQVGDLKVNYTGIPSGSTLSVLADQSHGGFAEYTTGNGYQVEMVQLGNQPATSMITQQKSNETTLTWGLRVLGFVMMLVGFTMFFGPLSTMMAIIPFLGSIARGAAFLAALVVSLPLSLIVAAISWIVFRPLVGGGLLLVAAGLLYGLHRWHRSAHPVTAPVAAPAVQGGA